MDEQWQLTRVTLDGTTFRARTWYEEDDEPSVWDVEEEHELDALLDDYTGASTDQLSIATFGRGINYGPAYFSNDQPWGEFQFEYVESNVTITAGGEEGADAPVVLDDFNRNEDPGWGTASSGILWDGAGGDEVDGENGIGLGYLGGEDVNGPAWMALFMGGVVNRSITMRYRFRDEAVPYMNYAFVSMSMFNIYNPIGGEEPTTFNRLRAHWYWNGEGPYTEGFPDDVHYVEDDFDSRQNWRLAKFDWYEGTMRLKSWQEDSAEPAWHEVPFDAEPGFALEGIMLSWYMPSPATAYFHVDWIETGISEFCSSISEPSDYDDVPTVDDGIYHTKYPYMPGTLRVFMDGNEIFQFTETDPDAGEFTLDIEATGDITCRYTLANRDDYVEPGGGGDWNWPVRGQITQEYGCTSFGSANGYDFGVDCPASAPYFHDGIDIKCSEGTPLLAPVSGVIDYQGWSTTGSWMVAIQAGSYRTSMGHMQPRIVVPFGTHVTKGQHIGYSGNTGNSTGPHCHWQVYDGDTPINPRSLL
jgi:hypothetical protein